VKECSGKKAFKLKEKQQLTNVPEWQDSINNLFKCSRKTI
jgi:hypothetical protein